jgi:hypothetical protein
VAGDRRRGHRGAAAGEAGGAAAAHLALASAPTHSSNIVCTGQEADEENTEKALNDDAVLIMLTNGMRRPKKLKYETLLK